MTRIWFDLNVLINSYFEIIWISRIGNPPIQLATRHWTGPLRLCIDRSSPVSLDIRQNFFFFFSFFLSFFLSFLRFFYISFFSSSTSSSPYFSPFFFFFCYSFPSPPLLLWFLSFFLFLLSGKNGGGFISLVIYFWSDQPHRKKEREGERERERERERKREREKERKSRWKKKEKEEKYKEIDNANVTNENRNLISTVNNYQERMLDWINDRLESSLTLLDGEIEIWRRLIPLI